MRDYFEARQWFIGAELLSLDFVRPVYGYLGVRVDFEESLRGIVRDALLGRYDERSAPLRARSPEETVIGYEKNILPALGGLAAAFGEDQLARLRYWVLYIRETDDNPWSAYEGFLSRWASKVRRGEGDAVGFLRDATTIARELKAATAIEDVTGLLGSLRKEPLSVWDRPLFESRGLLDIPAGSDYFPFVDEICLCVRMNRFQEFFKHFAPSLSKGERDSLESVASRTAANERQVFTKINDLPGMVI